MTPRARRVAIVAAVVILLLLGAVAPKLVPWLLGGAGALAGARRVAGGRRKAGKAGKDHASATVDRNARVLAREAERDQDLADAAASSPTTTPPDDDERERRRRELGSWDD